MLSIAIVLGLAFIGLAIVLSVGLKAYYQAQGEIQEYLPSDK